MQGCSGLDESQARVWMVWPKERGIWGVGKGAGVYGNDVNVSVFRQMKRMKYGQCEQNWG